MLCRATSNPLTQRRLVVLGIAIMLVLAAFITYNALTHRGSPAVPKYQRQTSVVSVSDSPVRHEDRPTVLADLNATNDPEAFARQVAYTLFGWDTTTQNGRANQVDKLIAVADPTGESTPGLVSDLDNYFPASTAWIDLARYQTQQWLTIDSATTPTRWAEAEQQAGPGALMPGMTALTIRGARHRSGVWEGEPVTSTHDVAFTMFIVCAPSFRQCHLLRLSMPDKPLD
jgi:hypothetical protein